MTQTAFVTRVLSALVAAGWTLRKVDQGGEALVVPSSARDVLTLAKDVDEARVYVKRETSAGVEKGWFWIVWQGPLDDKTIEAAECVADYSVNLAPWIERLQDAS